MSELSSSRSAEVRPKVLVVDDEPDNIRLLERVLRRHYDVHSAASGEEAVAFLKDASDVALILTDQRMPGMSGVELLRQALQLCPQAVRIVITGYTEFADLLDAINVGQVNRFMLKPVDPDKLLNVVTSALEVYFLTRERNFLLLEMERRNQRLVEHEKHLEALVLKATAELQRRNEELNESNANLQKANDQLGELALRDGLTGLYNHRYFQERLQAEVARARRYGHPLSLLFMDIDHFKSFNDRYGHPAGDRLLKQLAGLLMRDGRSTDVVVRVRTTEVVARYGGEEFAVILPETSLERALVPAERIRQSVADRKFELADGVEVSVTLSIGVASFPLGTEDVSSLILRADRALYRAKGLGRNRVCTYDEPLNG